MSPMALAWPHALAALACFCWAALTLWIGRGRTGLPTALACAATGLWALAVAASPQAPLDGAAGAMEVVRTCSWIAILAVLCARLGLARARVFAIRFALLGAVLGAVSLLLAWPGAVPPPLLAATPFLRLALSLTTVLLAENTWRNADEATRWHVKLPCIVLGGLAGFDMVIYADAALSGAFSAILLDARPPLAAVMLPLLAAAVGRDRRWRARPALSREVVLHGATLIASGGYLLVIGAFGEGVRHLDPRWGGAAEAGLLAAALMILVTALSARSVRSRLRRLLVEHFFAARYDYRREWLRCIELLSAPEGDSPTRAVRAMADAVDSPAGVLLLLDTRPGQAPRLEWAGSWNRAALPHALPEQDGLLAALGSGEHVLRFGAAEGTGLAGEQVLRQGPALLAAFGPLWLAVPLLHHRQGLSGVILLAHPRAAFSLDMETLDLLRMVGREVAMFLAEITAAERLAEGKRLADYAKRFAFVAHDLKTASSQLGLVLSNAEANLQDPEFQQDMLLTIRRSAERIDSLIARLRPGENSAESSAETTGGSPGEATAPGRTDPLARLRAIAAGRTHPLRLLAEVGEVQTVSMAPDAFDSAVVHLLDNAAEASPPGAAVVLRLWHRGDALLLDIADSGPGLSADFVRDELFRPFRTTKRHGSGIGAWQARELLRAAGGDITVISWPGAGTTMRLTLPQTRQAPLPRPARAFIGSEITAK
ncbi:Histidine kinase-, DNA gyrase B-, and HSP90-like ATPase [Roseomonas rosea]|uniref:histidine kinase n=1 Tax=Muricoccus roseus TaxID=198092 RepID=A0A1M6N9E8_9PROT|nr:XrtA/PEP-CTERM system histidine kinase PrsK [Roseomonas rosea]SHJ92291.1 Histidine kinase-, DNA gyrase B-, and HSP90-like ATPase [Roseomonas rosea]